MFISNDVAIAKNKHKQSNLMFLLPSPEIRLMIKNKNESGTADRKYINKVADSITSRRLNVNDNVNMQNQVHGIIYFRYLLCLQRQPDTECY